MTETAEAQKFFSEGYNCCQSMLLAFAPRFGIEPEKALRLGRAFGGGMGTGSYCGTVTGSMLILGFKPSDNDEDEAIDQAHQLVERFIGEFKTRNRCMKCIDLLDGVDVNTPEGLERAHSLNLFDQVCHGLLADASEILENLLSE